MKATPYVPSRSDNPGSRPTSIENEAPIPSGFWSMAFAFWLGTLFILYSKFFDSILTGFYIPKVVILCTVIFFLVSGRPLFFLKSTGGKIMLALVFWATFTLIFSVWKSGSIPMYTQLLQSMFFFALAAGLPRTVGDVRKTVYTMAFSGLVCSLLSLRFGADHDGRLAIQNGSYADPNYFGMALAAAVPLLWQMAVTAQSKLMRIAAWLGMPLMLIDLAKTGSRGAMLGFIVMMLLLFLISSVKTKIVLILVTSVGIVVVLATLPGYIKERYVTLFSVDPPETQSNDGNDKDRDRLAGDAGSSQQRRHLLIESVNLTFEHPIVGVGPGNFQTAVYDEARAVGIKHNEWMATHNSYTQISSETGFPGLILLLCLIGSSFKSLSIVLRGSSTTGDKPDPATYATAKSLLLSLVVISVCVFFLAVGYDFIIYVWAGLAVGLGRVYDQSAAQNSALEEPEALPQPKIAFSPAFVRVQDGLVEPPRTNMVSGRPVRFNRFR